MKLRIACKVYDYYYGFRKQDKRFKQLSEVWDKSCFPLVNSHGWVECVGFTGTRLKKHENPQALKAITTIYKHLR